MSAFMFVPCKKKKEKLYFLLLMDYLTFVLYFIMLIHHFLK